ncbi:MAG: hypothetical protein EXS14_02055 [Planctomycetes bacterium]|nr:hypothetical protein [Planctomycetota bacterium]
MRKPVRKKDHHYDRQSHVAGSVLCFNVYDLLGQIVVKHFVGGIAGESTFSHAGFFSAEMLNSVGAQKGKRPADLLAACAAFHRVVKLVHRVEKPSGLTVDDCVSDLVAAVECDE